MKIIVISDTHSKWRDAVDIIRATSSGCDLVIHLGDTARDFELIKETLPNINMVGVVGNNDFLNTTLPQELVLDLDGVVTFACHGHQYSVKRTTDALNYRALVKGASLALFGHTHQAEKIVSDGVVLFNPGALCDGCFGVIHIKDGIIASADTLVWDFYKGKIK